MLLSIKDLSEVLLSIKDHPIERKQERVRIESSRNNRGLGGVWLVISLLNASTSIHTLYTHVRHIHITHKL